MPEYRSYSTGIVYRDLLSFGTPDASNIYQNIQICISNTDLDTFP